VGLIGSTAVAARLWGLEASQLERAWGLAGSQVGGLVRNFGTMTKPFHAGEDGEPATAVVGSLGKPWELLDPGNFVKRWPCCYSNHRALGGLYTLIEKHALHAEETTEVV